MTPTWYGVPPPQPEPRGVAGWLRVVLRGIPLLVLVFGGLLVHLAVRLIEKPLCGKRRPVTPFITVFVCRVALRLLALKLLSTGAPMPGPGAFVANHSSWLDIFVLNAVKRVYFVSKADVARWPGIGWLARATGTVFIDRSRLQAASQAAVLGKRLRAGHKLLFFPEGTSSDGKRVLPFKTSLFSAFFSEGLRDILSVQVVSVSYRAPGGQDPRFYGWWGDMDFGPHLLRVLAAPGGGSVHLVYHPALCVAAYPDRKSLAAACEALTRSGFEN